MDESCLFFPELYRLYDKETAEGRPIGDAELRKLSELCTLCGLCPCPNIPADVIRAKTERMQREGLPFGIRLLSDVQRFGRWCGMLPGVVNAALAFAPVDRTIKKIAGIHPQRRLPKIARESFFAWARKKGAEPPVGSISQSSLFCRLHGRLLFSASGQSRSFGAGKKRHIRVRSAPAMLRHAHPAGRRQTNYASADWVQS